LKREALLRRLTQRLTRGDVRCGLITNGNLITRSNAKWIKQTFFQVQIGLDGVESATHDRMRGKEGAFAQAIHALELLGGGPQLGIVMALYKTTADQVIRMAQLATTHGVTNLYLPWLARVGRAHDCPELFLSTAERLTVIEKQITEAKLQFGSQLEIDTSDPYLFAKRMVGLKVPNAILYILPGGALSPLQWLPWTRGNAREGLRKNWEQSLATFWTEPDVARAITTTTCLDDVWALTTGDKASGKAGNEEKKHDPQPAASQ
jgi:MoaA/NifB/PqqE/SkfB family radical SAM enzyme